MMTMTPNNFGMAMPQQQSSGAGGGGLMGNIGGANTIHQYQTVDRSNDMGFLNSMSAFGPLMGN